MNAEAYHSVEMDTVTVCPAHGETDRPPTMNGPDCQDVPLITLDPQGKDLWVRARFQLPETASVDLPWVVLLSGKFASRVWVNEQLIGSNGTPGPDAETEQPGRMDATLNLPHGVLRSGENTLTLRMSSHHNLLHLLHPVHGLGVNQPGHPADAMLRYYWTSLLPFGALLLAGLYLLVLIWMQRLERGTSKHRASDGSWTLCLMALSAALQLLAEVSRGALTYDYPLHDVRLLVITGCSALFGFSLLLHVMAQVSESAWRRRVGIVVALLMVLVIAFVPGFDFKAAGVMLIPLLAGLILCLIAVVRRQPMAGRYAVVLALFCAIITIAPSNFLDRYFFYVVAALLIFMVIQQARIVSRHRQRLHEEQARADRLQLILDQQQEDPGHLEVRSVGKVERIHIADIAYCKGAGDYVELNQQDQTQALYQGSLTELEAELPGIFLRVHRSYLVNTRFIRGLTRLPSGGGKLQLDNEQSVPVSRRIMPAVRQELSLRR